MEKKIRISIEMTEVQWKEVSMAMNDWRCLLYKNYGAVEVNYRWLDCLIATKLLMLKIEDKK